MQPVWLLIYVILFIVLSIFDIKNKRIPTAGFVIVAAVSLLYLVICGREELRITDVLFSCVPGLVLVALSFLSDGKVGAGDGLLIMCLGPGLGLERIAYVLMGALIAGSLFSGILLALKKAGRNTAIPFVPFITIGLGVMGCIFTL